jgi:hypothetical protein
LILSVFLAEQARIKLYKNQRVSCFSELIADSGEYRRADIFGSDKKGSEGQGGWIQEASIQAERQVSCSTEVQG